MTFAELQAEVAAVLGIDNTDEATNAARFTKAGLRAISRAGAWEWLRAHYGTGITTVPGTYAYSLPSDLYRIDTRSIRTGGINSYLQWRKANWLDEYLGPDWKDSGADNGTPQYATRVGSSLWIARKPDSTWAAANTKIYFYYWRSEPSSGTLYLPDDLADVAVQAALTYGYLAEDDGRAESQLAKWNNFYLPELRGSKLDMNFEDQMYSPDWMQQTADWVDNPYTY